MGAKPENWLLPFCTENRAASIKIHCVQLVPRTWDLLSLVWTWTAVQKPWKSASSWLTAFPSLPHSTPPVSSIATSNEHTMFQHVFVSKTESSTLHLRQAHLGFSPSLSLA